MRIATAHLLLFRACWTSCRPADITSPGSTSSTMWRWLAKAGNILVDACNASAVVQQGPLPPVQQVPARSP